MKYLSLNYKAKNVGFLDAVRNGLAPDRGLYFPSVIPTIKKNFIDNINKYSDKAIALHVIKHFVGSDIPKKILEKIVDDTLNFDFPIVEITDTIATLELFHGPTLAFKDVGARFMARCLSYANEIEKKKNLTVLVATSGDTGGAVADGFFNLEGIHVVILFPKGKVSDLQERQLTTLGKNITALEIDGTFDECQEMVKSAFIDSELTAKIDLTSANSINIARWLSQMFYYFIAYKNRPNPHKNLVISVPSGNFGNICAGLMAKKMGLPIAHFIASTNINDTVPQYLETEKYNPKKSIQTISNAMDVGNPSNFIRIQKIFDNNFKKMKQYLSGYSYTDNNTKSAIKEIYNHKKYISDPHGAVGFLGLKEFIESQKDSMEYQGLFLETAHPIKFAEEVENILKIDIKVPRQLKDIWDRKKISFPLKEYEQLKSFLLSH